MSISGNTLTSNYLPAGNYHIKFHSSTYGFAYITNPTVLINFSSNPTATPVVSSFVGGK